LNDTAISCDHGRDLHLVRDSCFGWQGRVLLLVGDELSPDGYVGRQDLSELSFSPRSICLLETTHLLDIPQIHPLRPIIKAQPRKTVIPRLPIADKPPLLELLPRRSVGVVHDEPDPRLAVGRGTLLDGKGGVLALADVVVSGGLGVGVGGRPDGGVDGGDTVAVKIARGLARR
jgi:hypothetical protein